MNKFMISLIEHIGYILQPLQKSLFHPERFCRLLRKHGWDISSTNIQAALDEIRSRYSYDQLTSTLDSLSQFLISDAQLVWDDVKDILFTFKDIITSIKEISSPIVDGGTPFDDRNFWIEISSEIIDELIIDYIASRRLVLFLGLRILGIIKVEPRIFDDVAGRLSYLKKSIEWSRINDQPQLFKETFGWEAFNRDYYNFIIQIMLLLKDAGIYNSLNEPHSDFITKYYGINLVPANVKQLNIPFFSSKEELIPVDISFFVLPIPDRTQIGDPVGFTFGATLKGILDKLQLGNWTVDIDGFLGSERKVLFEIRPNDFDIDLYNHIPSELNASISYKKIDNSKPEFIMGNSGSTRIEIERIDCDIGIKGDIDSPEFEFTLGIPNQGGKIVIVGGDGDGFIQKILPEDPITIIFDIMLGYSKRKGFYISGGAGFEYTFQINKSFGPIFINSLTLYLGYTDNEIKLVPAISGGVQIGPISAAVDKIGLEIILEPGKPGLLGKADLNFGFKPPNGIGIAIDAESIKGGGFLSIDKPNYFGILSLAVQDKFDITAIGLLTTKLPDGTDIFSLLFALMAEFSPAIQLSFGFALSGVGGLIGIHRTMIEEALRDAQKAHTLETLLFPEDPIRDASLILTNIQNIFPVKEGRFVFGPMVKLFWGGAVPLVEFSVGIFLEVGGPIRIAIIGRAHAALPKPNSPIITLNLDILGFIDFGNKTLAIDAGLYDSNILNKFDLVGDMALRSNWGDNPDFAFSLGGFHPRFEPPPGFPDLRRLGIKFGKKNPRLSLTMYLAITTNSFQTGAMVDFFAKAGPVKATAGFGFDTLIYFKPFKFIADIYAWAKISAFGRSVGADLSFTLSGPNPYNAKGYAAIEILTKEVKVDFNKTFGNSRSDDPIISEPAKVLHEQLKNTKPIYEIPDWAYGGVILTEDAEDFLSPIGELNISQNAVPLDFRMDLFAEGVPPSNERTLSLMISTIGTTPPEPARLNTEEPPKAHFAPAKFKNMSDNEKISAPSFEKYKSGERIVGEGAISISNCEKIVEFETILRNPDEEEVACDPFFFRQLSSTKALFTKKIWAMQGASKYFKPMKKSKDKTHSQYIQVKEREYAVTKHNARNGVFERTDADGAKVPNMTYHEAMDIAKKQGRKNVVIRASAFAEQI